MKGYVNDVEVWVLRDTGCITICSSKHLPKLLTLKTLNQWQRVLSDWQMNHSANVMRLKLAFNQFH